MDAKQKRTFPIVIVVVDALTREIEIEIPHFGFSLYDLSDEATADLYRHYALARYPQVIGEIEIVYHEPERREIYLHDVRFFRSGVEIGVTLDQYNLDKIEDGLGTYIADEDKENARN